MKQRIRWRDNVASVGVTIVGNISEGASGNNWFAYGALADWEDTALGCYPDEMEARKRVEKWVRENLED